MGASTIPPIAIIGGGPCGLMLARLLQTASINYVVFERDDSPTSTLRSQGGTLDIHRDSGQEALRRAGLHEQFKSLARYDATTMTLMNFQGKFRASFGDDDGGDRPEIDRQQLRQLLLNSLPTDRIRWGKILDVVDSKENGETRDLTLNFRDGSTESGFRLIVGADGAWSKVRSLVTDAKPIYSGKSFLEGRISPDNAQYKLAQQIAGKGTAMAMSAKSTLAVQQLSDASYRIYMGVVAPESLTRPGGDADLNNMDKARKTMLGPGGFYDNWTQDLRRLIEASEGPWRQWPLYRLDKTLFSSNEGDAHDGRPRWKRVPGVALLGDAAHLATPNGEGVNQAMYDALVLFDHIIAETGFREESYHQKADAEALERAIVAYEKEMRPRAYEHIQSSIDMEEMMYADDGAQRMIEAFKHAHGES
ncbi:tetracycline resistance [Fusarium circinatum]|uniref:Tetracycline resistance n=1 Tax=Fusarium circinatum TaxID=48490 RepID=A0A8H5UFU4_FUSCI|nr:tetracycline resistance [Fusarium circinatum]